MEKKEARPAQAEVEDGDVIQRNFKSVEKQLQYIVQLLKDTSDKHEAKIDQLCQQLTDSQSQVVAL